MDEVNQSSSNNKLKNANASSNAHQSSIPEIGDNWIYADGHYVDGKIIATVPKLSDYDPEALSYYVDVALNG